MNEASLYLLELARGNTTPYVANARAQAILVTGSCAEGESDAYSDIDTILYYDDLPTDEELEDARRSNGGTALIWRMGERAQGSLLESYHVRGVECQFAHTTIAAWKRDMAIVLEELDVTSPLQKALAGLLHGIPLHGEPLIRSWQEKAAAYPDRLARAMIEKHLQFVPLWGLAPRLQVRDATIWHYQILVESAQNLLGVLAGLNRLYYSTFQFKRMRRFIDQMTLLPSDLAARLEGLFTSEPQDAAQQLEKLVTETLDLVAMHLPDIDLTGARKRLHWSPEKWSPQY
jgi:hypothetical protein